MTPNDPHITSLSPSLCVVRGHINVGVVRDDGRALLIDFGDGSVVELLRDAGVGRIDTVVLTHHHRDQACGLTNYIDAVGSVAVSAAEDRWFNDVASYWNDPKSRWHLYEFHPHRQMLAESVRVDRTLSDGDVIEWGPARIMALATPGHTDGSLSYLVEVDGQRVVFCGDLIHSPGRIWELYSLQKGVERSDYHGFLGARAELTSSLDRLLSLSPDMLVPSHGEIMREPAHAVSSLKDRLADCWANYVRTSALHHYWPGYFDGTSGITPSDPVAIPDFLRHFWTTWLIVSESGDAFVMDCGSDGAMTEIKRMLSEGEISSISGLWITHYHDDHVDAVPTFQNEFDCECIADISVAQVISDPIAWRLPCISPGAVRVDRVTRDGDSWQWHEFTMTAYHLPGQTEYHGGLLVEGRGMRLFFAGDSFTPTGIDDYCPPNRNFLGKNVGLDRCVRLVRDLKPDMMFNAHVQRPFSFTDEQCDYMLANLDERVRLYRELFPWDDPNFGFDESWARCYPYEQHARQGDTVSIDVVVTNHSISPRDLRARLVPPKSWLSHEPGWGTALLAPKSEGKITLSLPIPPDARSRRWVVPASIEFGGVSLPQFTEAIVVVD